METFIWALSLTVTLLLAVVMFSMYRSAAVLKRAAFIREYVFPQGLLARLSEKRPQLTLKEQQLVTRGLRQFFLCDLMAKGAFVSMPCKAVDDLWHEFILFTKHYDKFCKQGFGKFLHHTPAVVLSSQKVADAGLRRTWWYACKDETINPKNPTRLTLLTKYFMWKKFVNSTTDTGCPRDCWSPPGRHRDGDAIPRPSGRVGKAKRVQGESSTDTPMCI